MGIQKNLFIVKYEIISSKNEFQIKEVIFFKSVRGKKGNKEEILLFIR